MRKKNRGRNPPWTEFQNITGNYSVKELRTMDTEEVWTNSRYVVFLRYPEPFEGFPELIHLSFKRHDRGHEAHDWRDMQRIKNELIGEENEAVELFPAESRLVDTSNQYHIWVIKDPELRLPFGYQERYLSETSSNGSKQRPWSSKDRPKDVKDEEQVTKDIRNLLKERERDIQGTP